jgi:hypothetical protein
MDICCDICVECLIKKQKSCFRCGSFENIICDKIKIRTLSKNDELLTLTISRKAYYYDDNLINTIQINLRNFPSKKNISIKTYFTNEEPAIVKLFDLPEDIICLKCENLNIVDLDNLPTNLKKLICKYCRLKTLNNLPFGLEYLDCSHNLIKYLDLLPESLVYLDCSFNLLERMEDLPCSLKYLFTYGNKIKNHSALPTELKQLNDAKFSNYIPDKNSNILNSYKNYVLSKNTQII